MEEPYDTSWGISSDQQLLPTIPLSNKKILEIGPGDGCIIKKLLKVVNKKDIYAIQPKDAECSRYNDIIKKELGENFFETKLEDLKTDIKFDLILIYKWNINYDDTKQFIEKLKNFLNVNGNIYITSVEKERLYLNLRSPYANLYLIDKLEKYFKIECKQIVKIPVRPSSEYFHNYGSLLLSLKI